MAAPVPQERSHPVYADAQISASVRGRTWRDLAHLHHWIRAHGQQLIPAHAVRRVVQGDTGAATVRYRMHPSGRAIARVWEIVLRSSADDGGPVADAASLTQANVTFPNGDTVSTIAPAWLAAEWPRPLVYVEELAAKSGALAELALGVTVADSSTHLVVESVACWELPRAVLTVGDATDLGIDVDSLRIGAPIFDDGAANARSVAAIASGLADSECRRVLHAHAFDAVSTTSGSLTDLYALPVPLVPRKIRRTDTTAPVWVAVYAYASDGTTEGEIVITAASGDSVTFAVTSDTPGWLETTDAASQLIVACEDLSTDDGAPSGGIDTMTVQVRRTAGAGSVVIESVCVWEGPTP